MDGLQQIGVDAVQQQVVLGLDQVLHHVGGKPGDDIALKGDPSYRVPRSHADHIAEVAVQIWLRDFERARSPEDIASYQPALSHSALSRGGIGAGSAVVRTIAGSEYGVEGFCVNHDMTKQIRLKARCWALAGEQQGQIGGQLDHFASLPSFEHDLPGCLRAEKTIWPVVDFEIAD